jgi:hypothetical protein
LLNDRLLHSSITPERDKMKNTIKLASAMALSFLASSASAITITSTTDGAVLASTIAGAGVNISNVSYNGASSTASGIFTGGGNLGFNSGILLTTGNVACANAPSTSSACGGSGTTTSLKFDFSSNNGNVFFRYIFGSEEYNEYVGSSFNDLFELRVNGVNIATLPNGGGAVSINNVNNNTNSAYFRDNTSGGYDTGYDGLTTVLTAQLTGLTGLNTFEFFIRDVGDDDFDSGVFIEAGTFSDTPPVDVPEPSSIALFGIAMLGMYGAKRSKRQ